jgi:putative mycofactocin binding protein MftB
VSFDPERAYRLHPSVALRPEPFGALAYHYGNRKLVFLKSLKLVELVKKLDTFKSVQVALQIVGVPERSFANYLGAVESLHNSDMLIEILPSSSQTESPTPTESSATTQTTPVEVPAHAAAR